MKFKFVGNGESDPASINFYGIEFELNIEVEVSSPEIINKLLGNSHFEKVEIKQTEVKIYGNQGKK